MSPRAPQPIVNALRGRFTVRAIQHRGRAADLEIDAPPRGVDLNLVHLPRRNQTQRTCEQRFNSKAHGPRLDRFNCSLIVQLPSTDVIVGFHTKRRGALCCRRIARGVTPVNTYGVKRLASLRAGASLNGDGEFRFNVSRCGHSCLQCSGTE